MDVREKLKNVPLYQGKLPSLQDDANEQQWLEQLPLLQKQEIVKNFPLNFMTPALKKALDENTVEFNATSGTTEERLQIVRKMNWWEEEESRIAPYTRLWGQFIHDPSYSRAVLTTPLCSSTVCFRDNPSYEVRTIGNKLYLNTAASPDVWTQKDVQRMKEEIDRFRPMHMHADPIYLAIFFSLLDQYHVSPPKWVPNFLTLSFEFAPLMCRKLIRSFWDIPTFGMYGLTELGYLFCECENGRLHWCEPLNFLHFIPYENKKNVFNLAVTSLKNEYMPFVKYGTNDLFLIDQSKQTRCTCQHPSPLTVDRILGRQKDVTWTDDGQPITVGEIDQKLADLDVPMFLYQLDCSVPEQLLLKYMSTNAQPLSPAQEDGVRTTLETIYGKKRTVRLVHVPSLKPSPSGKFGLIKAK